MQVVKGTTYAVCVRQQRGACGFLKRGREERTLVMVPPTMPR
jgi:hypothetical protein